METIDFKYLFENMSGLFMLLTPTFHIAATSNAYNAATQTKREEVTGRWLFDVFPDNPNDPNANGVANLTASLNNVLKNKAGDAMQVQKYDIPLTEAEGGGYKVKYWSPYNSPVFNEKGEVIFILHRVEDVTEYIEMKEKGDELKQKTAEMEVQAFQWAQQLQATNDQLKEADKYKSEFFANVSHELRTPLALILAPLESFFIGKYGTLDKPQEQALQMVHNNAVRLLQLVNGLLDFAKFDAGKMKMDREPLNISEVTNSILNDFGHVLTAKKLTLQKAIQASPSNSLMDRYLYERILFNLLSNAVKFTPEDGTITVKAQIEKGQFILSIQDTGIGISAENIGKLFQKFRQAEGTSTRRFEGTGLGLAMVKEFAELLGGSVSVASTEGLGSTFTVNLPLEYTTEAESTESRSKNTNLVTPHTIVSLENEAADTIEDKEKIKLLVCEDNDELRTYIVSLLVDEYIVKTAPNGKIGWDIAKEWQPDIVLSDVMMPEMDGIELCNEIKTNPETAKTHVVLLTALTHRDALLKGWAVKADDYLYKPFHPEELVARLRSFSHLIIDRKKADIEIKNYTNELEHANKELTIAEEEMKVLMEEVKNRSKEMEQMAYIASHDLQQPLNNIGVFLQLLEQNRDNNNTLSEKTQRYLKYALGSSHSMRDMIRSLLDYSRLSKEAEVEPVDLNEVLQNVKVDLNTLIEEKNAVIEVGPMPTLTAYPDKIKMLFQNLINNAIKFQRPDTTPVVKVSAVKRDKYWEFAIKDNGIGIEEKHFEKVFQIFQRLQTKDAYEGTGIGLAHCKKITEMHRGKVWIESTFGEGTTFHFSIKDNLTSNSYLDN